MGKANKDAKEPRRGLGFPTKVFSLVIINDDYSRLRAAPGVDAGQLDLVIDLLRFNNLTAEL